MLSVRAFAHAIYSEFHFSRVQIPPVPVFPRASAFSAATTKVKQSTLLAQANTSSSHTQPCSHRIHQQVQILPPKSKKGEAPTLALSWAGVNKLYISLLKV
jgi:hypothetical protein